MRDAKGAVREHFSQDSPVEVPEKSLEALRRGNAVFTRSFTLPPGRYALELAVLDQAREARLGAPERPRGDAAARRGSRCRASRS